MKASINEVIKTLFKEKTMARINRYQAGQIFYRFDYEGSVYEFAIDTVTKPTRAESEPYGGSIKLSDDLGATAFNAEVRASELTRWIKQRALVGELIKLNG